MIKLKIKVEVNTLIVIINGEISDSDISNGIASVGQLLPQLKVNYSMIMEMSNYKSSFGEQKALFNKIIKSMNEKIQVGQIIRIVGNSKSTLESLCKMDKLFKFDNVRYVSTIDDAMKLVKGLDGFNESKCIS